ncbi:MAG: polyhydroxyalkanoic acid system family protein [Polaromonas sp.]|nr:polyhydroxyalkanoic acid system family protein [Polaromonas sp.]
MADIHIEREHALGLHEARKIAFTWTEQAKKKFDLACTYEEGEHGDRLSFIRSGVNGTLTVTADRFELNARLGFLLSAFKEKIEAEIVRNLDRLMAENQAT